MSGTLKRHYLFGRWADLGDRISPEEADRVFLPFQQANAAVAAMHGGTGLGLSISRELCERMGGSVRLTTSPGEGTTFTVTLPAAPRPEASAS